MRRFLLTALAVLGLFLSVAASPAQAGPRWYMGSFYDAQYGTVDYVYDAATGYVYFPAFRTGGYLTPNSPAGSNGLWRQNGAVGQVYSGGGSAYRNSNVGIGAIIDPSLGVDGIFISR
jgi:hypothetical protein